MKQIQRELTALAVALMICILLASPIARAEEIQAYSSVTMAGAHGTEVLLEDAEKTAEEKAAEERAEQKAAEKAAEEAEKQAAEKAAKEAEEKAAKEAEEQEAKEAAKEAEEQAARDAEMAALGLCPNPRIRVTADELTLLAGLIHCESGGEEMTGRIAVGAVVLNRVQSDVYENSIYDVIYAPGQFTPAFNGMLAQALAEGVDEDCYAAARAALNGENPIGDCLYFNCGYGQGIQIGYQHFY